MADMDVAVGVGRAVMQHVFRPAGGVLAQAPVEVHLLPALDQLRLLLGQAGAHRELRLRQIERLGIVACRSCRSSAVRSEPGGAAAGGRRWRLGTRADARARIPGASGGARSRQREAGPVIRMACAGAGEGRRSAGSTWAGVLPGSPAKIKRAGTRETAARHGGPGRADRDLVNTASPKRSKHREPARVAAGSGGTNADCYNRPATGDRGSGLRNSAWQPKGMPPTAPSTSSRARTTRPGPIGGRAGRRAQAQARIRVPLITI